MIFWGRKSQTFMISIYSTTVLYDIPNFLTVVWKWMAEAIAIATSKEIIWFVEQSQTRSENAFLPYTSVNAYFYYLLLIVLMWMILGEKKPKLKRTLTLILQFACKACDVFIWLCFWWVCGYLFWSDVVRVPACSNPVCLQIIKHLPLYDLCVW